MHLSIRIRALALLAALPGLCLAQATEEAPRERTCLVLSGGGARGGAHVGVLRVLEELRVPVDCIAGTSMGAIVGGLYAAGRSAEQLERLLVDIDWQDIFQDDPARRDLSFRRKQDDRDFLIDLELGVDGDGLKLPRGFIQGQKLNLLLRRQTLHVADVDDFDTLPIPFRAVATDIETGEAVVLGDGDLATAIRASMSVPAAFAPVQIDGRLLVDGGIANNMPIDVARAMGADRLIVVDIEFPSLPQEQLDSPLAITNQMLTLLIARESRRQLETLDADDIYLEPPLGKLDSADFGRTEEAMQIGARATRELAERLRPWALTPEAYAAHRRRAASRSLPVIDYVDVQTASPHTAEVIATRLDVPTGGAIDVAALEAEIARIYGLATFELVDYRIDSEDGRDGVVIETRDKSWGPNYLSLGANLEDDLEGSSQYTLGARYTRTGFNRVGTEWRTDLQIGARPRLFSEYFQPLGPAGRFFVAPQLELERFTADRFEGGERVAQVKVSTAGLALDVGRQFDNWGELRIGLQRGYGRASQRIGPPGTPSSDFDRGGVVTSFRYDTVDNPRFPRHGTEAFLSWEALRPALGSDASLDRVVGGWLWANTPRKGTWTVAAQAGSNLRGEGQVQDLFELGGLFGLSGFESGQLRGQHFAITDLLYYRRINARGNIDVPVYAGASLEFGNVWDDSSEIEPSSLRVAGSVFIGVDSFIGPLYLAYGLAEGGNSAAYLLLGTTF